MVMLGNSAEYVRRCRELFRSAYPRLAEINEVAYGTDRVTWVHTIHPKAQGRHVPDWLAGADNSVGRKLAPAREAVRRSRVTGAHH